MKGDTYIDSEGIIRCSSCHNMAGFGDCKDCERSESE